MPGRSRCDFDSDELIMSLEATIPADVRAIEPVVERILDETRKLGCATDKEFEIRTALHEALANAVVHGARQDPRQEVAIWVGCDQDRGMIIVVRDPGSGFDPKTVPSPLQARQLYSEHGRGIYLINELMDEVRFAQGGTEIWMRKR
jgi:serine/threonine-protein kinase RsbW